MKSRFVVLATMMFSAAFLVGCGAEGDDTESSSSSSVVSSLSSSASSIKSSSSINSSSNSSVMNNSSSMKSSSSVKSSSASATFKKVNISAPSLANNLIEQAAQRDIWVYLPKAYYTSTDLLPVIYYLPGFGDNGILNVNMPSDFNTAFDTLNPAIVVVVDGINRFGGSFFVNSSVTGNWADYVTKDVVEYVDATYRTIPNSRARGIAGHSMGGFGALDLAMRNPTVFGSVFALAPGLVGSVGLADTQMFDSPAHIKSFINSTASWSSLSAREVLAATDVHPDYFDIGYAMAFAPKATPPFFEYPYTLVDNVLVRDDAIWAKWEAGFGAVHAEVDEYKQNLSALNGIGIDCGTNDEYQWIKRGCDYFDAELTAAEIDHTYTTHTGAHQNQLRARILNFMLPFFSENLARE